LAKEDRIPTDLTIDLGDDLAPDEFLAAVRNFLGYVAEITNAQSGDGADVAWTVKVREGSSMVGVEPDAGAPKSRLAMIYRVAEHAPGAVSRGDLRDSGVSERAVGHLKALSELASRRNGGRGIHLWVKRRPVSIGPGIARAVREDMKGNYYDYGVLEGRLQQIRDASGSIRIAVNDLLYPKSINCAVPEDLLEIALQSFRKRVEVEGRIHYRKDGTPIGIEAENIEKLPEDDELPSADDVRGIMAGL